jgi:DNA-3-methyladenine glycosylase I
MSTDPALLAARCAWTGRDPLYVRYHDEEWGVPQADDRALFEKLILEGFQAGLSWITILRKREHFRRAFDGFDPEAMARYKDRDVRRLMADPGIVRNRLKIEAAIANARAFCTLVERRSLASVVWSFLDDGPIVNEHTSLTQIPAETALSKRISKELKGHGFRFVGPTTLYAFMQSVGMINDHLVTCPRHIACRELQRAFRPPVAP